MVSHVCSLFVSGHILMFFFFSLNADDIPRVLVRGYKCHCRLKMYIINFLFVFSCSLKVPRWRRNPKEEKTRLNVLSFHAQGLSVTKDITAMSP